MIARLEGVLCEKTPTRVVLDVAGVGYEVFVPVTTFYDLPEEGKTVALRIHTHVREEAIQLYGFRTVRERAVFELLIRANGVGPRLAQTILSGIEVEPLVAALREGNVGLLRSVPGLGAKKAERLVVELRDRADLLEAEAGAEPAAARPADAGQQRQEEAVSALLNLGYPRGQAESAVEAAAGDLDEATGLEALIREALRRLSK